MRNHDLYKQLKAVCKGLPASKLKDLPWQRAAELLGRRDFTATFFANAKRLLLEERQHEEDETEMHRLRDVLLSKYPDAEFERERVEGRLCIHVWPRGKPKEITE